MAHAFAVFTGRMGQWWPSSHHIGSQPFRDICIEPHQGGQWYERDASGNSCAWGYVLAYQPPHLVRLAWHLSPDFTFDPDPLHASEVELSFAEVGPNLTQLEFVHRHLDRHGEGWQNLSQAVDSKNGWSSILGSFAALATANR